MRDQKSKILFVVLFIVFWSFWLFDIRTANDFPWISQFALVERFDIPRLWTIKGAVGLGEYGLATLWGWSLNFLYGLGASIGLSFAVLERLLGVIPYILIGAYSTKRLFEYLEIDGWARVVASLFYLLNTYILLVIDGGQFAIALAYAWFPLTYLLIIKSISNDFPSKLLAGLSVAVLGFFDIRFVYVLFLLIFFKFIYDLIFVSWKEWFFETWEWIKSGVVIGIVFAGLHAYWIIPAVLARAPQLPAGYADVSQTSFLSFATLGHALLLLQPHWFKNVFGKVISLQPEFYLIPILVFLSPILVKQAKTSHYVQRVREVGFWLVVALIGVFLVKGSLEPWEGFYPFIFSNIPGFSMFRDPTKFFFLVAISYSVLIGYSSMFLVKKFNWRISFPIYPRGVIHIYRKLRYSTPGIDDNGEIHNNKLKNSTSGEDSSGKWKISIIPLLLITYFLLLIYPVWTGKMTGTFSEPYQKEEFIKVAKEFESDRDFGRILWIPSRPPMGYASPTHPSLEANRLLALRPFALGTVGTYETLNYLRESEYMEEILDISSVAYLGYTYPDERREELKPDNIEYYYAFLDQLTGLPWTGGMVSGPPAAVIKTKESQDHFFVPGKKFSVIGSMSVLEEMVKVPGFELDNNLLLFAEDGSIAEKEDIGVEELGFDQRYLLFEKDTTDLTASFITPERMISPSDKLSRDPMPPKEIVEIDDEGNRTVRTPGAGWWKRDGNNIIEWRDFLQQKYGIDNQDFAYGGGWAVAEGEKELDVNRILPAIKGDRLLVRVMHSRVGGKIEFFIDDEKVGEVDTIVEDPETVEIDLAGYGEIPDQAFEFDKAEFHWIDVAELPVSTEPLTLKTTGELNVVNQIAFVRAEDWQEHKQNVERLTEQDKVLNWNEELITEEKEIIFGKQIDPEINYQRKSATEYQIEVLDFPAPAYLVFSETFDTGWKLERLEDGLILDSQPAYTFLNGFMLPSGGEYRLYFEPQKYVMSGLIISITTLSLILMHLIKSKS